eukprot:g3312.t1
MYGSTQPHNIQEAPAVTVPVPVDAEAEDDGLLHQPSGVDSSSHTWSAAAVAAISVVPEGQAAPGISDENHNQSWSETVSQIVPTIAGALVCSIAAGELLSEVQAWSCYREMRTLLVMAPMVLAAKDNCTMTAASRLTTLLAMGEMDTRAKAWSHIRTNMAVVQVQTIALGALATTLTLLAQRSQSGVALPPTEILAIFTVAMLSLAGVGMVIGIMAVATIVCSHALGINPDNVATPVISSLGDIIALVVLSFVGSIINTLRREGRVAPMIGVIAVLVPWVVGCCWLASCDKRGAAALTRAWVPIIGAGAISFTAGMFLDGGVRQFADLALLLPVMNGFSGTCCCVFACRASTAVMTLEKEEADTSLRGLGALLLALSLPCGLVVLALTDLLKLGEPDVLVTSVVVSDYIFATIIQTMTLLVFSKWLVDKCLAVGADPDNYGTPIVNSASDVIGSSLLWCLFSLTNEGTIFKAGAVDKLLQARLPLVSAESHLRLRRLLQLRQPR